ncbi:ABC transporter permease [Pollutibacter soli]|uniref:ABC transporter permease n=1 Tax=Pollutibacter soli TaxID=3034157 RepID=UPI003013AD1D
MKAACFIEMKAQAIQKWDTQIKPESGIFEINLGELWQYRDLLWLLVRRDFVAFYKQTILGPIWFFIQPLLTTLTFMIVFSRMAKLSTDGLPPMLFYLSGVTCWMYFSESFTKTSDTFIANANIFGKVYFPRLVIPLSIVISNLIRFGIQFCLFLAVWLFYMIGTDKIHPNIYVLLLPLLVLLMAGLALGLGIIFSSLTTKYRDLRFLLAFGVQLLMFATPVILPLSAMNKTYSWIIKLNPITPIIETFRYMFLGTGTFSWTQLGYSTIVTIVLVMVGILVFNKVEKSFMDTV